VRAYVALGSNLGDRNAHLATARTRLDALPGTRVIAASAVEETAPLGGMDQPDYLNQMVLLETTLSARGLLTACRQIERAAGRVRRERWEPRTLDLDIVRFGDQQIADPDLTVPHPGLAEREFWRREVAELEHHDV
jgi:2-amino-4-hydroxy-6-hydroxymethyldihydropteridine diphosphokinase